MPLKVSSKGGDFKPVPQGTHLAICNMIVDLGKQETLYGEKHQLYIRWELPTERITYTKDGQEVEGPMSIGSFYTASLDDRANLRGDLESWRGKSFTEEELQGFDVFNVLGAPCQVTITHNEKGKARITGVAGWPKGVEKPKGTENTIIKYSADEQSQWEMVPEWLQQIVMKQIEDGPSTPEEAAPANQGQPFDDDVF